MSVSLYMYCEDHCEFCDVGPDSRAPSLLSAFVRVHHACNLRVLNEYQFDHLITDCRCVEPCGLQCAWVLEWTEEDFDERFEEAVETGVFDRYETHIGSELFQAYRQRHQQVVRERMGAQKPDPDARLRRVISQTSELRLEGSQRKI